MNTIKLIFASVLGGAITLGSYLYFFPPAGVAGTTEQSNRFDAIPAYNKNNSIYPASPAESTDFTRIAQATVNAVVHVKNVAIAPANPLREFFYGSSTQEGPVVVGAGSGVIVSGDGYIITNSHVISGAKKIEVTMNDKRSFEAEIIGIDKSTDIALLKINAGELPYLGFGDSNNLQVGEWVLAVGNPYNLTSTVTAGIVSAKARDIRVMGNTNQIESFIQTDAAVNPGNSGGALVNTRGELIGINTAISSQTGSYVGYSFAIPSNIAKKVIEDLLEFGNVQRAYMGINFDELDSEKAAQYGVSTTQGIIITNVAENGAASEAGLKMNDVIVKVDEIKISKFSDLQGYLGSKRPGDEVQVTVLRNNQDAKFKLKLKNQFGKESIGEKDFSTFYFGELNPISDKNARKFKIDYGFEITSLKNKSLNERYGIVNGDIILAVEDTKVETRAELDELLQQYQSKEYINVLILKQNGTYGYIRLRE
jgi:Do/DeqQ family serine protease